jgi:ParB family chromosome partitioning protein
MTVDIQKVIVGDRIRKDFGDVQGLADDIRANGLINPPVVIPRDDGTYELLAGERRLRAMRLLGWKEIEVRLWKEISAAERLEIEASENEQRKEFTPRERYAFYERRLKLLEEAKRKGGLSFEDTRGAAMEDSGLSGGTRARIGAILQNEGLLDPKDIADWDARQISTNTLYKKLKEVLAEKKGGTETAEAVPDEIRNKLRRLERQLKTINDSYQRALRDNANSEQESAAEMKRLSDEIAQKERTVRELMSENDSLRNAPAEQQLADAKNNVMYFCGAVSNFLRDVGGYAYVAEELNSLPEQERAAYLNAVANVLAWAQNIMGRAGEVKGNV